jgi:hypothetical protein
MQQIDPIARLFTKRTEPAAPGLPLVCVGGGSPWGRIQGVKPIMPGMAFVSTASHGGVKVAAELNARIPAYMRRPDGWYEEDCEWAIPFVALEGDILSALRCKEIQSPMIEQREYVPTLCRWFPDAYEKFFSVKLQPGESYIRDEQTFKARHSQHLVVVSAMSDSKRPGFCRCCATVGGVRGEAETWLYIPTEEYKTRDHFGFVVLDPSKYEACPPTFYD